MYNSFCLFCVGGNNHKEEILSCDDKNCPFHWCRDFNLDYQISKKVNKVKRNRKQPPKSHFGTSP